MTEYKEGNKIYTKKIANGKSAFPLFKMYIYRGSKIGEAVQKLKQDIENKTHENAETTILTVARHAQKNNKNYGDKGPLPPNTLKTLYRLKYKHASNDAGKESYRYRIVDNNSSNFPISENFKNEVENGGMTIGSRGSISIDPWKSKDLIGCVGIRNSDGNNHPSCAGKMTKENMYCPRCGGKLLYATTATDSSLLQLNEMPPVGATLAGWDARGGVQVGSSVYGLHHPNGDWMEYSEGGVKTFGTCTFNSSGGLGCSDGNTDSSFIRALWSRGVTEGGSSGSGLFYSGRLVGTLTGGNSQCGVSGGSDYYGRFDKVFNSKLKNWLAQ